MRSTLDTLAFDAPSVTIVGEHDHPIRNSLIARESVELGRIEAPRAEKRRVVGRFVRFLLRLELRLILRRRWRLRRMRWKLNNE